jgi:cysteinyl-tRNA synthetase
MEIRFYNTLTHRVERFEPIDPPNVYMYNCGPTVYDYAHIGNFRAFVFADVLRRFLELTGLRVQQVMNLTDVGHMTEDDLADGGGRDKMALAMERMRLARKKDGRAPERAVADPSDPYQVAAYYIRAFLEDARLLRLKVADEYPSHMPRATEHIPQMQRMIAALLQRGCAYVAADGAVYFDVQSFPGYGALSGNTLDRLRQGAGGRVRDEHQASKRHPADFLLWKPDPAHLMKWDSPWGAGYPGWHIECSAMATSVLGRDTIDIHTGGEDNIFPHHECEIAQSWGATGRPLARFWMHTRFLLVEGQKMSKSKGNFYTLRDLIARGIDPGVVRYELLKAHYRANMNFTFKGLEDSAHAVRRLREKHAELAAEARGEAAQVDLSHPTLGVFAAALADDLNMSGALGEVFKWVGEARGPAAEALAVLRRIDAVLGVVEAAPVPEPAGDGRVAELCRAIDAARAVKDFATADRLRRELVDAGYEVRTGASGTAARRRLA